MFFANHSQCGGLYQTHKGCLKNVAHYDFFHKCGLYLWSIWEKNPLTDDNCFKRFQVVTWLRWSPGCLTSGKPKQCCSTRDCFWLQHCFLKLFFFFKGSWSGLGLRGISALSHAQSCTGQTQDFWSRPVEPQPALQWQIRKVKRAHPWSLAQLWGLLTNAMNDLSVFVVVFFHVELRYGRFLSILFMLYILPFPVRLV